MSVPTRLNIKRKASDLPPDTLILPTSKKQQQTHDGRVYVLERLWGGRSNDVPTPPAPPLHDSSSTPPVTSNTTPAQRRVFFLDRLSVPGGKRARNGTHDVATFAELPHAQPQSFSEQTVSAVKRAQRVDTFKRPGKGSALPQSPRVRQSTVPSVGSTGTAAASDAAVGKDLHRFAVDEAAREQQSRPQHSITAQPKLSGARSREIHAQRVSAYQQGKNASSNGARDAVMADAGDVIYDSYVLLPIGEEASAQLNLVREEEAHNVGYLMISEDDREMWDSYVDEEADEYEYQSDEEDENAEGYYGADYPEDELDSDDEHDRNPYSYYNRGEDWDETAYSDDDEYERMMNPWRQEQPRMSKKSLSENTENASEALN